MKASRYFLFAVVALSASGCVINQEEQRMVMQQQHEDSLMLQEDLRRIRARLDALEQDLIRLNQQVQTANRDQSSAQQAQIQGLNASLTDLQQRIRTVDAAREADKKEIVDRLSKQLSDVLSKQQAAARASSSSSRRPISNEGYEHLVQPGETISAIAKAYNARVEDIVQANNLKSADVLRVGQKLFVPAP